MTAIPRIDFPSVPQSKILRYGDLYCGAGGGTVGVYAAAEQLGLQVEGVAINHWDKAISTHRANFPAVRHLLTEVEKVNPCEAVPGGKLDLLLAGPSCTHFSQARGGKPVSEQQRSGAWEVITWARRLDIRSILVENVREFLTWGPLRHKRNKKTGELMYHAKTGEPLMEPDPDRKEMYFRQWVRMLRALGYTVEWKLFISAHYGDATTRQRLFIQAQKGGRIRWPLPTHRPPQELVAFPGAKRWKTAREIIDWSIPSKSMFGRKERGDREHAENTRKRVVAGLAKVSGLVIENPEKITWERPLLVVIKGGFPAPTPKGAPPSEPDPFIVPQFSEQTPRSVDAPLNTITTTSRGIALAQPQLRRIRVRPFTVYLKGTSERQLQQTAQDLEEPLRTVHGSGGHFALVEPTLDEVATFEAGAGNAVAVAQAVDENGMPIEPFVFVNRIHGSVPAGSSHSVDEPVRALTTGGHMSVVQPKLMVLTETDTLPAFGVGVTHSGNDTLHFDLEEPLRTITTARGGEFAIVQPSLAPLGLKEISEPVLLGVGGPSGQQAPRSMDAPFGTLLGENHLGFAQAVVQRLEPFVARYNGGRGGENRTQSVDEALSTLDTSNRLAVVEPTLRQFIVGNFGEREGQSPRCKTIDAPLNTITGSGWQALVEPKLEPFIVSYYGNGRAYSLDEPLPTVTTKDRFALVEVFLEPGDQLAILDIHFRMFVPKELARAHSFPEDYEFAGGTEDRVRQVGNSWTCELSTALNTEVIVEAMGLSQ